MNITWIGVDPGQKGAVGAIFPDGHKEVYKTPLMNTIVNKKKRKILDFVGMSKIIKDIHSRSERCFASVELVRAMQKKGKGGKIQGQGITSAFSFGKGAGVWIGIIVTLGIPYHEPSAQAWKKTAFADLGKNKDKSASVLRATQLYPELRDSFIGRWQGRDVFYDGPAEAMLIARHGMVTEGEKLL